MIGVGQACFNDSLTRHAFVSNIARVVDAKTMNLQLDFRYVNASPSWFMEPGGSPLYTTWPVFARRQLETEAIKQ